MLVTEVVEISKLIDTLGFATTVLAVILVVFLAVITYILYQNKQLMKNVMTDNKKIFNDLNVSVQELTKIINANTEISKKAMSDVVVEVEGLKTKYIEVSRQLFENIYDERCLSDNAFYDYTRMSVMCSVYKSLIDIISTIDQNGFSDAKRIDLLKETIITSLERRKNETKRDILSLNYDINKIDYFDTSFEATFSQMILDLKESIVEKIDQESLFSDSNYLRLKSLIKNKMFEYLDEMIKIAKDISRS